MPPLSLAGMEFECHVGCRDEPRDLLQFHDRVETTPVKISRSFSCIVSSGVTGRDRDFGVSVYLDQEKPVQMPEPSPLDGLSNQPAAWLDEHFDQVFTPLFAQSFQRCGSVVATDIVRTRESRRAPTNAQGRPSWPISNSPIGARVSTNRCRSARCSGAKLSSCSTHCSRCPLKRRVGHQRRAGPDQRADAT